MPNPLLPALDATPIPGPIWLFHLLLVLTFFLHLVFMNLTLGGTLLAAVARWRSRGRDGDPRAVLADRLVAINTYGISLTITTGVAPLLFMQTLYQQYFYPATILVGTAWLAFLVLLAVGYYAVYAYKLGGQRHQRRGGAGWLTLSALLFVAIAAVHVAVNLVHSQPAGWARVASSPAAVLADPTFFPRLLHFVFAGIAFSALVIAWWAVRQGARGVEVEVNRAVAGHAWHWALAATLLQVVDGFVLLLVLPREVLGGAMRGGAVTLVPLGIAILLALALLMLLARVRDPLENPATVTATLAAVALAVAVMAITRHQVRALYLASSRAAFTIETAPQWGTLLLFVVLLVAGLATVAVMVRRVLGSPATGDDAA